MHKKSNIVDCECMYNAYKFMYRRPIFNSLAVIMQLIDF